VNSIRLVNFLSFGEPGLSMDDIEQLTVLVGPNGAGKTNILRGLDVLSDWFSGARADLAPYFHRGDPAREMRLSVTVRLSPDELEAMADLLVLTIPRATMFESEGGLNTNEVRNNIRDVASLCRPLFRDLFGGDVTFEILARGAVSGYTRQYVQLSRPGFAVFLVDRTAFARIPDQVSGWTPVSLPRAFANQIAAVVPGAAPKDGTPRMVTPAEAAEVASRCDLSWFGSLLSITGVTPPRMELRAIDYQSDLTQGGLEVPELLRIADRLSSWQLDRYNLATTDFLGGLFRGAITRLSDARTRPERWTTDQYAAVPPTLNLVDGSELSIAIMRLKDGSEPASRQRYRALSAAFQRISGFQLDVVLQVIDEAGSRIDTLYGRALRAVSQPKPDGTVPGPPRLLPAIVLERDGVEVPLELSAAGIFELLLVLFVVHACRGSIVLLDEPALNLHPAKQRELSVEIKGAAKALGAQLILVTHSPFFVEPSDLGAVARVEREGGTTLVHRLPPMRERKLGELRQDLERYPKLLAALFARKVVLVEGPGEEAALPIWLQKCAAPIDLGAKGVEFISVDGQLYFARHRAPLEAWHIPFKMIGDGKAGPILEKYGSEAFAYPSPDLSRVMEDHFQAELDKLGKELGSTLSSNAPAVVRVIAHDTDPPSEVRAVWDFLQLFLTAP
jgi:energy-coupling factor transporter ATP-binding protein EcfA2